MVQTVVKSKTQVYLGNIKILLRLQKVRKIVTKQKKTEIEETNSLLAQQIALQWRDYTIYGKSLRQISKKFKTPWESVRDRFARTYGKDFAKMKGKEGSIFSVIREHLSSYHPESKEYKQIMNWLLKNSKLLIDQHVEDLGQGRSRLLTQRQIDKEAMLFVTPGEFDLRDSPYLQYRDELDPLDRLIAEEAREINRLNMNKESEYSEVTTKSRPRRKPLID